ncbi:MAG: tetratricopeptide repeat protein [Candidatus Acidiferrum sp.]
MAICNFVRHPAGKRGWRTVLPSIVALGAIFFIARGAAGQQAPPSKQSARPVSKAPSPFADAEELLRQGKLEDAQNKLQEELLQNPSRPEGYALLGLVYTAEKNYTEALTAFQQGLKLNPKSTGIRNDMGNLYVAQGNLDLAEKEFREVVRLNPANYDGNYNLALVLLAKRQPAAAIPCLLRIHPQTIASQLSLTRAYLDAGKTAEGLRTAGELSARNKDDVQVHFTLGVLLAAEKQLRAAQLQLEQASVLQPQTFEILYNLGQVYVRNAEFAKAELTLKRALNLKPDSPETLSLLAEVYSAQQKPVDALDLLVRAHKLAPENTDVIYYLARVSMSQNYYEDSIPLLETGLKIAPQRMDLHAALGESYFMSGRAEKAIEEFKQLTEMDPTARSYAFLGLCYRQLGRFDEARTYFQEGLKKDPRNPSCLFNIGYIEERQGNHEAAEQRFQEVLRLSPDHAETLLELANLRITSKRYAEAAVLLRKYVRVSRTPAPGYYKLAMVERSLHQTEAAQRDMSVFQTLSKNASNGPYPYEQLFDYLDNRSKLTSKEKAQLDLTEMAKEIQKQPDRPENLYLLAEGYLKLGKVEEARKAITQLDQLSAGDFRTQTGIGVLLARYRLYQDAIQHFQAAMHANPDSDDIKFDLADAYFRKGMYPQALEVAQQVSANGQQDDAFLSLLGDIKAHLGQPAEASEIFKNAIRRNPDNDQYYLSLALVQLRQNDLRAAEKTLQDGRSRIPGSGKLLWGRGLVSVLEGKTAQAGEQLEQAVDLLPEWPGSYSTLGVFYYQTGQLDKAKEVLNRFKGSSAGGGLDVNRIAETLEKAPSMPLVVNEPMPMAARQQLLQFAISIADRTL